MPKVQTSLRIEKEPFNEAKDILNALGMNFSQAVNIFTNMVVQSRGLPFEVKIPNKETANIIKEARLGTGVDDFSIDELK